MWTKEQEQADLLQRLHEPDRDWFYDFNFPIWRCPECQSLNRFVNTFGESCLYCRAEHTLDWERYIVDPEVRADWGESETSS